MATGPRKGGHNPEPSQIASRPAPPAPVQYATILGAQGAPGPQAPPDAWKQWGDHVSYDKGAVVGNPIGGNIGPGTLNAEGLFVNGVAAELGSDGVELYGVFDATNGAITWNQHSGLSGTTLPGANPSIQGRFFICSVGGDVPPPGGAPPDTYVPGDWLTCDGATWVHLKIAVGLDAQDIALMPPMGLNGYTNVEDALAAVVGSKGAYVLRVGDAMTGPLVFTYGQGAGIRWDDQAATVGGRMFVDVANRWLFDSTNAAGVERPVMSIQFLSDTSPLVVDVPVDIQGVDSFLSLNADPTQPLHAVTLRYLESVIGSLVAGVNLYGVFDASNGTIRWNSNSGQAGNALPPPTAALEGAYLICSLQGSVPPTGAPPDPMYMAGDWLICNGVDAWFHLFINGGVPIAEQIEVNPAVAGAANVQDALEAMLPLQGGAMTGSLILAGDPIEDLEAATKGYVDNKTAAGNAPPVNPAPGTLWFDPVTLQLYVWFDDGTSVQWVATSNLAPYVPPADFLPLAGGTLTGPVTGPAATFTDIYATTVSAANAVWSGYVALNGADAALYGFNGSSLRWHMSLGYPQSETGAEAGSNFTLDRFSDAGGYIDTPFSINRKSGNATFAKYLTVSGGISVGNSTGNGSFQLMGAPGSGNYITAYKGTPGVEKPRWQIGMGDSAAESGGNAGSNLYVARFDDAGGYLSTPISIDRATGQVWSPNMAMSKGTVNEAPVAWNDIPRKYDLDQVARAAELAAFPIGGIMIWPTNAIPGNFLVCNGGYYNPNDVPLLFNVIGGQYGWDGTNFAVPYIIDRTVVGQGNSWGLSAAGGEIWHTLSEAEMPYHVHGLYDPTHVHGVGDPTHSHGLADPSHAHGAAQDAHSHYYEMWDVNRGGSWVYGQPTYNQSRFGNNTGGASAAGTYVYGAYTGCWNYGSGTGIWLDYRYTGQSVYGAGSSWGHNNMPPFIAMNFIIRYR